MAGNVVKIQIKADADTAAIERVAAQLAKLKNQNIKVKVDVDDRSLNKIQKLQDKGIKVGVNQDQLRRLESVTQNVDVDLDENGYRSRIEAMTRPRDQVINVRVNGGGRSASGDLTSARNIKRLGNAIQTTTKAAGLLGAASMALGAVAVTGPYAIAGALGTAAIAGGSLATVMTGGIAGGLIASAARAEEVREHFSYMANDVSETMKGITQNLEQPLVRTATALGKAFHESIAPSLSKISQGTEGLLNQFNDTIPAIAQQAGPALEKMFNAGVPGMQKLISSMPRLTEAFGNFFESLGSENVQKAFSGFMDWLPKGIEGTGNLIEDAANGYYKLKEFLGSDELKPMRDGLARFAENLGDVDWGRAIQGATDLANSFGDFLGNVDLQDTADTIGEIAGGLSNIVDFIDGIGAKNAILAGIGAYIAGGILAAFGKSFAAALGGKIAGALLGGAVVDAVETLADTVTDIFGNAIGNGIGSLLGNLFGGLLADLLMPALDTDLDINNINLPDDMPKVELDADIKSLNLAAEIPPIQVQAELSGLTGLPTDGQSINIPVTYSDPGFAPAAASLSVPVVYADPGFTPAAVTVPVVWGALPPIPTPPPVKVPLEVDSSGIAGQISGISIPPIEVPVTVNMQQNGRTMWDFASEFLSKANAQLEAVVTLSYEEPEPPQVPPVEVKVTYSTEGMPTMPTPPPMQVPVTYQVQPLNIPVPPAVNVPVTFNIEPINIPAPPAVQVTVTSNADQVAGQLNAIPKSLSTTHTVSTNVDAVRGQIESLNGLNTSSTHTINVVQTGAAVPGQGEDVPR